MDEPNISTEDAIALFRYRIILPILEADKGTIRKTVHQLSKNQFNDTVNKCMVTFSERTLFTYYSNFKKYGFEGLKPNLKYNKKKFPSIQREYIQKILALKAELPTRSAQKIINLLEISETVEKDLLNPRTVNRILSYYGYTKKNLSKDTRVYVKHEKEYINEMWQSDIMHAFYIPNEHGENKLVYLFAFIDDYSRRILHGQFYFDSTLTRLEDCLKKAIIKFGAPKSLYIDNGSVYISENFKLICAKLGINLKFSTPYHPQGKGKIERFWHTVQCSFIPEVQNYKVSNIIDLNNLFHAWLKEEYHDKDHSSIGCTPIERWDASIKNGIKLKFFSPIELEKIFLHHAERTVSKYGVVKFEGNIYEVDGNLVGKKITIRYNPFHLDILHIYYENSYFGVAEINTINSKKHTQVKNLDEDPNVDSVIVKQYFKNIKSNYEEYLNSQISMTLSKEVVKNDSDEETPTEEKDIFRAPKDVDYVIDKGEFLKILSDMLQIPTFTFAQKGKLYDLWDVFKEFNRDILISILSDIKLKSPDFENNFIYYLSKIKEMYLSKTSKGAKS